MPAAPRSGHDSIVVPTGDHAYLLDQGGTGQVFDVTTSAWGELPVSPIRPGLAIWTGSEIVAVQGTDRSGRGVAAAAYDPRTDAWRTLPPPPIEFDTATATWSGRELILVGAVVEAGDRPTPSTVDAAAFDPITEVWRTLPGTGLYPESFATVWDGNTLIAWDYYLRWRSLDPSADGWSSAEQIPLDASECDVSGAVVGTTVFAWNCGQAAILHRGVWSPIHGGPLDATVSSSTSGGELRLWRFADQVLAGDVLVLPMTGITLAPSGEPCYGCPGSPESLWVYRPSSP
jgi:hypothetical protein